MKKPKNPRQRQMIHNNIIMPPFPSEMMNHSETIRNESSSRIIISIRFCTFKNCIYISIKKKQQSVIKQRKQIHE